MCGCLGVQTFVGYLATVLVCTMGSVSRVVLRSNKAFQLARFACWTVCKLRFCGFASQKYSTTRNLQTAAELGVCVMSHEMMMVDAWTTLAHTSI